MSVLICSHQSQLSICVRYIYKDNVKKIYKVTKDFCGFVELKRTDAETISSSVFVNLRFYGFTVSI